MQEQAPEGPQAAIPRAPRRRRRGLLWLGLVLVVGLLGVGAFVVSGPYRTLSGLRAALVAGDASALPEFVDFPALRQNLKLQLLARANSSINSVVPNGLLSQMVGGIAGSVVDNTVDALVTPSGLARLFTGAAFVKAQLPAATGESLQERLEQAQGSFASLSRFEVTIPASPGVVFELTRSGLDWRLTNVRLGPSTPSLIAGGAFALRLEPPRSLLGPRACSSSPTHYRTRQSA